MMGIEAGNQEGVGNALGLGWEPFAVHAEPQRASQINPQIVVKTIIWFKKKGALEEFSGESKTEKPGLNAVN